MRRASLFLMSLIASGVAGCVPLFYAYPSISYVPTLNIGPSHDNVYVFRVDAADDESCVDFADPSHYRLRQVHVTPAGKIVGQSKVAIDSGFYWNGIVLTYTGRTSHTLRLRLYRAGYDSIDIHSWQGETPLAWKEAPELESQEKAVDALLAPTQGSFIGTLTGKEQGWSFEHLDPGSASREQRHVLLFAAGEFERLAAGMAVTGDLETACDRCRAKASFLRKLAER